MKKNEVKKILMSLKNSNNDDLVINLLGKIDMLSEEKLQHMITQIGDNDESITKYLQNKLIVAQKEREQEKHVPINKLFEYGIAGTCIHLHMPVDLREMIAKIGPKKTFDTVNMYLLDAIEKIRMLQNNGFYKFNDKDCIYMISPILVGREMKFLEELDFETRSYSKKELQNKEFVKEHPEAQLAVHVFGSNSNIGTAKILFDVVNSKRWQTKKNEKVKQFENRGISLEENKNIVK